MNGGLLELFRNGIVRVPANRPSRVVVHQGSLWWPILLGDGETWAVQEASIPADKKDSFADHRLHGERHFKSEDDAWYWIADITGAECIGVSSGAMSFRALQQAGDYVTHGKNSVTPVTERDGKACPVCGEHAPGGATFCSNRCRQRAYRERKVEGKKL